MEQDPNNESVDKPLDASDSVPSALAQLHNAHSHRHIHRGDRQFLEHVRRDLAKVGIEQAMNNCLLPADLARNIEHLTSTLSPEAKDDTTLDSLLRKLRGRDRIIHQAISHYISTLIQFSNITRTNAWRDSEEIRDQLIAVDQRRRRNHNTLIESITIYTKTIKELEQNGYLDDYTVVTWDPDEPPPDQTEKTVTIFSNRFLQNRDRIKDWAIAVDVTITFDDIKLTATENDEGHRQ